jgi:hypothetical protein
MARPGQRTARASPQRPAAGVGLLNNICKQKSSLLPGLPLPLTDLVLTAPATAPFPQSLSPRRLPPGRSYSYRRTHGVKPRGHLSCIGDGVKCIAEMLFIEYKHLLRQKLLDEILFIIEKPKEPKQTAYCTPVVYCIVSLLKAMG